jgi:hypothetical protein
MNSLLALQILNSLKNPTHCATDNATMQPSAPFGYIFNFRSTDLALCHSYGKIIATLHRGHSPYSSPILCD